MSNTFASVIVLFFSVFILNSITVTNGYRILAPNGSQITGAYFRPFDKGFVGNYGDPATLQRERINEGAVETPTQELLYEGVSPRQTCPGMVGPFSDGNYYCTAREYGYCDRRSGACFCNVGYQGIDCSECMPTHFNVNGTCYAKKLCPNDCSASGTCDYWTGTCTCYPHRQGNDCSIKLCTRFSDLCQACTAEQCLLCKGGYYLTGNSSDVVCRTCYDFDPRCAGCTKEEGCTTCADPLLTSVRRSGYRVSDPRLPLEEDAREFSITLPFGTKSPESYADAESFVVASTPDKPLKDSSMTCAQGENGDASWNCTTFKATHIVCGHLGVFSFTYANYVVKETDKTFRVSVRRTGGGVGNISVSYYINHLTTNESDVSATAPYTTSQQLIFSPGIVERTFLVGILDDTIVEENEVFQIVLETPEGGGSIGAQFRTNVTIIDDDLNRISSVFSYPLSNATTAIAGQPFDVVVQAMYASRTPMETGGEYFIGIVEDYDTRWRNPISKETQNVPKFVPGTGQYLIHQQQSRHSVRTQLDVQDFGNGTYGFSGTLYEQGIHDLRIWNAFRGGLLGQYYYDAFFENLALSRIDQEVKFEWGTGRLIPRGSDYISVRWTGLILPLVSNTIHYFRVRADDHVRLWIDGDLLVDHIHQTSAYLELPRAKMLEDRLYEVVIEYTEIYGEAYCEFMWGLSDSSLVTVPSTNLFSTYLINNMPVEVKVLSTDTDASTTECTGEGLYSGEVGVQSSFEFCPRDAYRNFRDDVGDYFYLQSELFSSVLTMVDDPMGYDGIGAEVLTPVLVYDNNTHCFSGTYTPYLAGTYQLNITFQPDWYGVSNVEHVAGSPFMLEVKPTTCFAPYSDVHSLPSPLELKADECHNFTIVSRDIHRNFRYVGGDDFEVYMYRVDHYFSHTGITPGDPNPNANPTNLPSSAPSSMPTILLNTATWKDSPPIDSKEAVVRYGVVTDHHNGNYTVEICPVISGQYEIHVLLNGRGVSNQPFRILDKYHSFWDNKGFGLETYAGQYVDKSPYNLMVSHGEASPYTSTAWGNGLKEATVGIPAYFEVTVRDAFNNVLIPTQQEILSETNLFSLTAELLRTPGVIVNIWNYYNGSFIVDYNAVASGSNLLAVMVNGLHIKDSPFTVNITDGATHAGFSYITGGGLHHGQAGVISYFQLFSYDFQNNRKTSNDDRYTYVVSGANSLFGELLPCPKGLVASEVNLAIAADPDNAGALIGASIACDQNDEFLGHYWGEFTPTVTGNITIAVYLNNTGDGSVPTLVDDRSYDALVIPAAPVAELTTIQGDLHDKTAGEEGSIELQLWDRFKNRIYPGGHKIELALLGVGGDWGTIQPWGFNPGSQDAYYYGGFYYGYPNTYGSVLDHQDGTYTLKYKQERTGQYVLRIALVESGLNVTYFNTTDLGTLVTADSASKEHRDNVRRDTRDGHGLNVGSSRSWTGDISNKTYYGHFYTGVANQIDLDLSVSVASKKVGYAYETHTPFLTDPTIENPTDSQIPNISFADMLITRSKFRQEHWSSRWFGLITPDYAEVYNFTVHIDDSSRARLFIGGVGNMMNITTPPFVEPMVHQNPGQEMILNISHVNVMSGSYNFTNKESREIVMEYIHTTGTNALVQLFWSSPSTPYGLVPTSAFSHWKNMSHYNHTIHPATLCPRCSTAYGESLQRAMVAHETTFVIYARDIYGNLMQRGGDVPTMVAVGPNGVAFRGDITDYGNSTYLVTYYPTQAGQYRMYVTMGCCAPHPNVGLPAEIHMFSNLLIEGAPFLLTVSTAPVDPARSIAIGKGVVGGYAGDMLSFTVEYRDVHNNPTSLSVRDRNIRKDGSLASIPWVVVVKFVDRNTGNSVQSVNNITKDMLLYDNFTVVHYNMTKAGNYDMYVSLVNSEDIVVSFSGKSDNYTVPKVESRIYPEAHALLGSPYRVNIAPNKANPILSVVRGNYIHNIISPITTANKINNFEIQLRDSYNNPILHGGQKIYTRLVGSSSFFTNSHTERNASLNGNVLDVSSRGEVVIPHCVDHNNGKHTCTYTPIHSGPHDLHIELLNYTLFQPGGQGLVGKYFAEGSFGEVNNADLDAASRLSDGTVTQLTRIDPLIAFTWPDGFIFSELNPVVSSLPKTANIRPGTGFGSVTSNILDDVSVTSRNSLKSVYNQLSLNNYVVHGGNNHYIGSNMEVGGSQSIQWSGFIYIPRTDTFAFSTNIDASGYATDVVVTSIYVDDVLIYDSISDINKPLRLLSHTVYKIQMITVFDPAIRHNNKPIGVTLRWSSPLMPWVVIPQFYLYDSSTPLLYTPFPIDVVEA